MSKELHMIYYGKDGDAAKAKAAAARADRQSAQVRHAEIFDGVAEECAKVIIMDDVSGHDAGRIHAAYGDKVVNKAPVAAPPPIPVRAAEVGETGPEVTTPVALPPVPVAPTLTPNRR